jgi:hypothetical protein
LQPAAYPLAAVDALADCDSFFEKLLLKKGSKTPLEHLRVSYGAFPNDGHPISPLLKRALYANVPLNVS